MSRTRLQWVRGCYKQAWLATMRLLCWRLDFSERSKFLHYMDFDRRRVPIARWRSLFIWFLIGVFSAIQFLTGRVLDEEGNRDLWLEELRVPVMEHMQVLRHEAPELALKKMRGHILPRFESEVFGAGGASFNESFTQTVFALFAGDTSLSLEDKIDINAHFSNRTVVLAENAHLIVTAALSMFISEHRMVIVGYYSSPPMIFALVFAFGLTCLSWLPSVTPHFWWQQALSSLVVVCGFTFSRFLSRLELVSHIQLYHYGLQEYRLRHHKTSSEISCCAFLTGALTDISVADACGMCGVDAGASADERIASCCSLPLNSSLNLTALALQRRLDGHFMDETIDGMLENLNDSVDISCSILIFSIITFSNVLSAFVISFVGLPFRSSAALILCQYMLGLNASFSVVGTARPEHQNRIILMMVMCSGFALVLLNAAFVSWKQSINNWCIGQRLEKVNNDLRRKSEVLELQQSHAQAERMVLLCDHDSLRRDLSTTDILELDATLNGRPEGTHAHQEVLESVVGEQDELMASWRIQARETRTETIHAQGTTR